MAHVGGEGGRSSGYDHGSQGGADGDLTGQYDRGLSVVMIGRNESAMLPKTLPLLMELADEVVFVDTGSNDETRSIARDQGARLFERPWDDDFSAARNHAIDQARFTWLLSVDCDEEILHVPQTRALLEAQVFDSQGPARMIRIENLRHDGAVMAQDAVRLFRNHARIRFQNPVHESINDALYRHWPKQPPEPLFGLRLRHHGYRDTAFNKEKLDRNLVLMERWVEGDANNIYARYKLGASLVHMGQGGRGLMHLNEAFRLLHRAGDRTSYPFLPEFIALYEKTLRAHGRDSAANSFREIVQGW